MMFELMNRYCRFPVYFSSTSSFSVQFSHSVMSDSATSWTAAHQASLSISNSQSLLKLRSIESVMASNHIILCHPLLLLPSIFPSSGSFPMSQFFTSGGQSIGASLALLKKLQGTELCNQKAQSFFRSLRIPEP